MTPLITVAVPVSTYHLHHLPRALASVRAQTIPVEVLVYYDEHQRGAGYARNRLIDQCMTDLIVFLDADDELMPEFASKTLAHHQRTHKYVFTDYLQGDGTRWVVPECAYAEHHRMHLITTLLPTAWARAVQGFSETMDADEDSEFYIHLSSTGHCGTPLHEPLVIYHIDGQRSGSEEVRMARQPEFHTKISQTYRGNWMGCCGDPPPASQAVIGERVLVRPAWGYGTRSVVGHISGVRYPHVDAWNTLEIDRRDLEARPDLWQVVEQPKPEPVVEDTFDDLANFARNGLHLPQKAKPFQAPPAPVAQVKPDVERVLRLAHKVTEDGRSFDVQSTSAGIVVSNISRDEMLRAEDSAPTTLEALQDRLSYPPVKSNDGGWTMDAGAEYYVPTVKRTADPVFVFPAKDYPSYTDVHRLIELSGFQSQKQGELDFEAWENPDQAVIFLAPEQPTSFVNQGALKDIGSRARLIWWNLEYGGEYEPDLTHWRGEVWACDPTWAQAHNAKLVVMGSHPELADTYRSAVEKPYDFLMLAYMTERRQRLMRQLADLKSPAEPYPGYMMERTEQLIQSKLMLHAHQRDDTPAIAPQRFALCAAYKLPLIHEAVPDAGEYDGYAVFEEYTKLAETTRFDLDEPDILREAGVELHNWLCIENTFRISVERALHA
jgi:hypothetical protein